MKYYILGMLVVLAVAIADAATKALEAPEWCYWLATALLWLPTTTYVAMSTWKQK